MPAADFKARFYPMNIIAEITDLSREAVEFVTGRGNQEVPGARDEPGVTEPLTELQVRTPV